MLRSRRVLPVMLWLVSIGVGAGLATPRAAAQDAEQLWADFCHYVLIAQPELAGVAGAELMGVSSGAVLDAVEASRYEDPTRIFRRADGMEAIAELAGELQDKIQTARLERSREPQRIADDIQTLGRGQRAFDNATQRLAAAGPYAAPQMLAVLLDNDQQALHPAVTRSMRQIGRPLVAPLAVALPQLDDVGQARVARVLGEIAYPQAMPALKRVAEDPQTDPNTRDLALDALAAAAENARVSRDLPAAELYLALGLNFYNTATENPGALDAYDDATDRGVLWRYNPRLTITGEPGLVPLTVPGPVAGDVVAMQAAADALALDPDLDGALSLYLAANLRRENRLPDGADDPSYTSDLQEPMFYAMLAGPRRLHDVLRQALDDGDSELALDAIAALSATASLDALQPLQRGLGYPDRRVRFRAAEALARAMPEESFDNDFRVVPVLADAVRQTDVPVALVIGPAQDDRNALNAALAAQGYQTLDAPTVAAARGLVAATPGIDLVAVRGDAASVRKAADDARANFKLAIAPIVALADSQTQPGLSAAFNDDPRVTVLLAGAEDLEAGIAQTLDRFSGEGLGAPEALEFALTALGLLERIAVSQTAYDASTALPALVQAVGDPRPRVAVAAGVVLSKLDDPTAQAAVATAAINADGEVQVNHLVSLAESANAHGNLIPAAMSDDVLALVRTSEGPTAIAAAQAHGALALPTRNAVDLILSR
ncbi:MAG: HEAT repeat domain-containing protein [Planctomycetota bacterium]